MDSPVIHPLKFYSLLLLLAGCTTALREEAPLVAIQIQDRNGLIETVSTEERLSRFREIDFLQAQPYQKVSRMYRKGGKNCAIITSYHSNGLLAQYLETEDMRAHGLYREWYASGQLK